MHTESLRPWTHSHEFDVVDASNERRTLLVVVLTAAMMVVEILGGLVYGSMALLADGWHMGTHVAALGISAFAYRYARKHATDPCFTFGTGKVGVLGGFISAVVLAIVAVLMAVESIQRFFVRPSIRYDEALFVAAVGLVVNVVSAVILGGGRAGAHHSHAHSGHVHGPAGAGHQDAEHAHAHDHPRHTHDHNLRAAYLHVVADALTSVLAIVALTVAKFLGHVWADPLMGIVGGAMIARWSYGLLRDTGRILLDADIEKDMLQAVRSAIESAGDDRLADLHVWKVGPESYAAIVSVVTSSPQQPEHYRQLLAHVPGLSHVSVEVHRCQTAAAQTVGE
jgi:cation diffusion facilitator family transporter